MPEAGRTRPVGQPLSLSPEQLDQAAEVTPVDVVFARALWQQWAPKRLHDLLEAAVIFLRET